MDLIRCTKGVNGMLYYFYQGKRISVVTKNILNIRTGPCLTVAERNQHAGNLLDQCYTKMKQISNAMREHVHIIDHTQQCGHIIKDKLGDYVSKKNQLVDQELGEGKHDTVTDTAYESVKDKIKICEKHLEDVNGKLTEEHSKVINTAKTLAEVEEKLKDATATVAELSDMSAVKDKTIQSYEAKIAVIEQQLAEYKDIVDAVKESTSATVVEIRESLDTCNAARLQCESALENVTGRLSGTELRLADVTVRVDILQKENETYSRALQQCRDDVKGKIKDIDPYIEQLKRRDTEIGYLRNDYEKIKVLTTRDTAKNLQIIKDQQKTINSLNEKVEQIIKSSQDKLESTVKEQLGKQQTYFENKIKTYIGKLQDAESEASNLRENIKSLSISVKDREAMRKVIDKLDNDIAEYKAELNECREQKQALESSVDRYRQLSADCKDDLRDLREEHKRQGDDYAKKMEDMENELSECRKSGEIFREQICISAKRENTLRAEKEQLEQEIESTSIELQTILDDPPVTYNYVTKSAWKKTVSTMRQLLEKAKQDRMAIEEILNKQRMCRR